MASIDQAITRIRERLDAGSYGFTLYHSGDDAHILPDVPTPFGFVVYNNEGSIAVAFGGGRGNNLYRNRMRIEAFVFSPMGYGVAAAAAYAEAVAAQLRAYRDDVISCFDAPVIPFGPGSNLSVPGLASDVSNYQCAVAECVVTFDQIGGWTGDVGASPTVPGWVPVNAKIHIDLVNNRAWTEADGIVAVDTLLGSDSNSGLGSGSGYDASGLSADGYITPPDFPILCMIGSARTRMLAGTTFRVQLKQVADVDGVSEPNITMMLNAADGSDAVQFSLNTFASDVTLQAFSFNGPLDLEIDSVGGSGFGQVSAIAVTMTDDRCDCAANGSDAAAGALDDSDRPVANPFVAAGFLTGNTALQSITIYDPLADTTGLSELSVP